jgi:hypothetical protein
LHQVINVNPVHNKFNFLYAVAHDWNLTPNGPEPADDWLPSRDIIPIVKALYGDSEIEGSPLPPHWASHNPDVAAHFFHSDRVTVDIAAELGYDENHETVVL